MRTDLLPGTALPGLGPYRLRDYDQLPDEPRFELVFGRLHVTPSPASGHQIVAQVLCRHLEGIADASGGIVFQAPLDVVLADHSVVQPDLVYVSAARLEIVGSRIEGIPDLLVEILSPGSARLDRREKLDLYARSGVQEYWLVDYEARQSEFLINEAGRFVAAPSVTGIYRSRKLPEIYLDVSEFWRQVHARLLRLPPRR
jgi:Uma2 family endonuclease